MVEQHTVADFAFKKMTGIDINTAMAILLKKGITIEEMQKVGNKVVDMLREEADKKNMDDHNLVLYHLTMSYFAFKAAMKGFDAWIKGMAAEHNMKPDKYVKIMYK